MTTNRLVAASQDLPLSYRVLRLNREALVARLEQAPLESLDRKEASHAVLSLPLPDRSFARFRIEESPIMEPALAAKFPEIKSYQGRGIDEPTALVRFDWSPQGFHALILGAGNSVQIIPRAQSDGEYLSFYTQDASVPEGAKFQCGVHGKEESLRDLLKTHEQQFAITSGTTLRTYRLAVAATRNWTNQFGGGTQAGGVAAINTVMNLVNAVYQRELSIRMVLVANNDQIVHTNGNVGPYTDNEGNNATGTTNGENQTHIDNVIGSGNYDIGHVFGRFTSGVFAGLASVGVVCAGNKARGSSMFNGGVSASAFDILVVIHEMGHQFGATHTFNDSCGGNRNAGSAWEPDSGSTIMSYGSQNCSNTTPGLQPFSDLYFHVGNLNQIVNYVNGGGNCSTNVASSNNVPAVNAGPNFTIPQQTPFTLTATGSDADGDPLTFTWEQFDLGAQSPPNTDDGSRPIFRSFLPTTNPSRTLPSLTFILNNANNPPAIKANGFVSGESLPTTNRVLNFQVTARDNRTNGAFSTASMQATVTTTSGPFAVTQPNTPVSWPVGSTQTITWDVAGTTGAPVSCANVRLLLSTDGGFTFNQIVANTPNDGTENIIVPNAVTTQARIKVEAVGNIFFDISNTNFTIEPSADLQLLSKVDTPDPVVTGNPLTYTITVRNNGPNTATNVTVTDNLPAGAIFKTCNSTGGGLCGGVNQNRTVTFASLAAGATQTITIVTEANCALTNGSVINNSVTISSPVFDPNPSNNSGSASTIAQNPPPIIICPPDFDVVALTPGSTTAIVTFPDPVVIDNCPVTSIVCNPPSGSAFPLGTTTVNCTVTDSGGETASCSFKVTVWDALIQDDESGDYLLFNTFTGEYKFVRCSPDLFTMTGQGEITRVGCITTLHDDSRVNASFNRCIVAPMNTGQATIKRQQPDTTFVLKDSNILNNSPNCP